jgi:leucyl-tRNA synthetase
MGDQGLPPLPDSLSKDRKVPAVGYPYRHSGGHRRYRRRLPVQHSRIRTDEAQQRPGRCQLCGALPVYVEGIQTLVLLLAPFAPHIAEELWHQLGYKTSVHQAPWPVYDPEALVADEITLVIQIMGKTRGTIEVPADSDKAALENYARRV